MKTIILTLLMLICLQPSFAKAMEAKPTLAMDRWQARLAQAKLNHDYLIAFLSQDKGEKQRLLEAGAYPNVCSSDYSVTQLHFAVWNNDEKMVKSLIDKRVNVNAQNPIQRTDELTPLMRAAENKNEPICKLLLDANAAVNPKGTRAAPPIWGCLDSEPLCRLFIAHGATPGTIYDSIMGNALHYSAKTHKMALFNALTDHYINQHKGFLVFLGCIKKKYYILYKTNGLFKQYFSSSTTHLKNFRELLSIKNGNETAYDLWPIEELNPATCTYAKYMELELAKQDSNPTTNETKE